MNSLQKENSMFKLRLAMAIALVLLFDFFLYLFLNPPKASAEEKGKSVFTLSNDTIGSWLDDGSNHVKFITWASECFTKDQVDSFEVLVKGTAPADDIKLEKVRLLIQTLELRGIDDPLIKGRLDVLKTDLELLTTPAVEEPVEGVTPESVPK